MRKFRVGILLNSYNIASWYLELIRRIHESDISEVALVVMNGSNEKPKKGNLLLSKHLLYTVYQKLDKKAFKKSPDSQRIVNAKEYLKDIPHITVIPEKIKYYQKFPAESISQIKEKQVDVFLRVGFGIMKGDILTVAPLGIWSYHHGDDKKYRGMPSCFWEVYNKEIVTGAMLQILTEELDSGITLSKGFSKTDMVSVNRTRHSLYWRSLSFFTDNLRRCAEIGIENFLEEKKPVRTETFIDTSVYKAPGNGKMLVFLLKLLGRLLWRRVENAFQKHQWRIIYAENDQKNLAKFKTLIPPKNQQWADCFAIKANNNQYIFFENIDTAHFGTISYTTLNDIKNKISPKPALKCDYHLSYPFVFEYEGEFYMMPETKQANRIEIFRAKNFPAGWEPFHVVMDNVAAVDSSLFQYNGKWWLFTNMARVSGAVSSEELHIFYSTSPFSGQWQSHPMNPVVSDARNARNAGSVFMKDGKLFRPSQDCATMYGYSVTFNEITELSENFYREEPSGTLLPHWDKSINGIHTAVVDGNFWVMDIRKKSWFSIK